MAANTEETKISLKIFVDKEKERVVFAEADYSFIDILFSFMTLPMGTILRLLRERYNNKLDAPGNNLYQSVANLPVKYFPPSCKHILLNPGNPSKPYCKNLKLDIDEANGPYYFICDRSGFYQDRVGFFSTCIGTSCCCCGKSMDRQIRLRSNLHLTGGVFVMDTTSYIVTDSLRVMGNTPASIIRVLKDFGLDNLSHLEERTVDIGLQEIQEMLILVLFYEYPLSCLFLRKTGGIYCQRKSKSDTLLSVKETSTNSKKMTLKVTWQRSTGKVLFVEAGEDFIDLAISFLRIPLGSLIGKNGTTCLGSIDNLYASILNMSVGRYIKSVDAKDMLLEPQNVKHVRDYDPSNYLGAMPYSFKFQDPTVERGFIKGRGMFMVTDDLVITPLSSASSIEFVKKLKVPLSDVEELEMSIGMEEGLRILIASLKSSSALTDGLKLPLKKPKQENLTCFRSA